MRPLRVIFLVGIIASGLNSNAVAQEFLIDTKSSDMSNYFQDLQECKQFSEQQSVAGEAATHAVGSALLGAAIGAVAGDSSEWASSSAKWGAVEGLATGAMSGYEKKRGIVRNCLTGRGYKVLN